MARLVLGYRKNWNQGLPVGMNNSGWNDSHRNQTQNIEQAPGTVPAFRSPSSAPQWQNLRKSQLAKEKCDLQRSQRSVTQQGVGRLVRKLEPELKNPNKMCLHLMLHLNAGERSEVVRQVTLFCLPPLLTLGALLNQGIKFGLPTECSNVRFFFYCSFSHMPKVLPQIETF